MFGDIKTDFFLSYYFWAIKAELWACINEQYIYNPVWAVILSVYYSIVVYRFADLVSHTKHLSVTKLTKTTWVSISTERSLPNHASALLPYSDHYCLTNKKDFFQVVNNIYYNHVWRNRKIIFIRNKFASVCEYLKSCARIHFNHIT